MQCTVKANYDSLVQRKNQVCNQIRVADTVCIVPVPVIIYSQL